MVRKAALSAVITAVVALTGFAQAPALLSLSLVPGVNVPLGADAQAFGIGGAGDLRAEYRMPFFPVLFAGAGAGYSFVPLKSITSMSLISASALVGARLDFLGGFSARVTSGMGYYYAFLNDGSSNSGSNPFLSIGADLSYALMPALSIGLGASYRNFLGLYNDLSVTVGVSYNLLSGSGTSGAPALQQEQPSARPAPLEGKGITITNLAMSKVFPIFHSWYDTNPIGKMTITNTSGTTATDVAVTLLIKQYMDAPKECAVIRELKPGESRDVSLLALFTSGILEITQTTKVAAEIEVAYASGGKPAATKKVESVSVYDRNALTWDDNNKAAAFVTPKEPTVLYFSNNVNAMAKKSINRVMDKNLQTGMLFHDALRLYGISYVSPPLTSYAVVSQDKQAVDSVKFARETFSYRSGDCSDLSILYCSLLESVQIETAFITVPGHIFMAFALDMSEDQARKSFIKTDELIFKDGKAWVPVEVTERSGTFLTAWQLGARQWRENLAKGQADFYPVRAAWQTYPAVFFPGASTQPPLPEAGQVISDFQNDLVSLVSREIGGKEAELQAAIKKNPGNTKAMNSLGLLYARYDMKDKAEEQFKKIVSKTEYMPALLNLGNLAYLQGEFDTAQGYYQRAYRQNAHNPSVLLAMARVNHEQQNYGSVKKYYQELRTLDPDLASTFAYLDLQGTEAVRAAQAGGVQDKVMWEDSK